MLQFSSLLPNRYRQFLIGCRFDFKSVVICSVSMTCIQIKKALCKNPICRIQFNPRPGYWNGARAMLYSGVQVSSRQLFTPIFIDEGKNEEGNMVRAYCK